MSATLRLSETFHTFQGEGPSTGRPAFFVRTALCNLRCSFRRADGTREWCDADYTWRWDAYDRDVEVRHVDPQDVAAEVAAAPEQLVVITGGEPLLQQRALAPVLAAAAHRQVEVETNGTLAARAVFDALVTAYNVSPKLGNSGNRQDRAVRDGALFALARTGKARWKFVCATRQDVDEAASFAQRFHISTERVWIMPLGDSHQVLTANLRRIAAPALDHGFNVSGRLHIDTWEGERAL